MKPRLLVSVIAGVTACSSLWADLASTIAKVKPSVVIVGSYNDTHSPRFRLRGTGFVVGNGNMVITNAHVLEQPGPVEAGSILVTQVRLESDKVQMRKSTVLQLDPVHDLALLSLEGPAVPALTVGDSDAVQEGQSVAFTGFPIGGVLGFSPVTHRGVVSSIAAVALPAPTAAHLNEKSIRSLRDASGFNVFQLDGTAYPGNSGGPLFEPETGEVLGVVNMVFVKGTRESALTNPSGISYAIPARFVLELLQRTP